MLEQGILDCSNSIESDCKCHTAGMADARWYDGPVLPLSRETDSSFMPLANEPMKHVTHTQRTPSSRNLCARFFLLSGVRDEL